MAVRAFAPYSAFSARRIQRDKQQAFREAVTLRGWRVCALLICARLLHTLPVRPCSANLSRDALLLFFMIVRAIKRSRLAQPAKAADHEGRLFKIHICRCWAVLRSMLLFHPFVPLTVCLASSNRVQGRCSTHLVPNAGNGVMSTLCRHIHMSAKVGLRRGLSASPSGCPLYARRGSRGNVADPPAPKEARRSLLQR